MNIQTQYTLARNSQEPGIIADPSIAYVWPGTGASANVCEVNSQRLDPASLVEAVWHITWEPYAACSNAQPSGVQLLHYYTGADEVVLATVELADTQGPHTGGAYITEEFRALLAMGKSLAQNRQIGNRMRSSGNGKQPRLFSSVISCVWSVNSECDT